jgi:UDP-N-acetylmuramyl-tripeptide synthetase
MALHRLVSAEDALAWLRARLPSGAAISLDSRCVTPGAAFIAWPGHAQDGRHHVAAALRAGAVACLVEAEGVDAFGFDDARIACLPGLKAATAALADAWFGQPSAALDVIATTGTNGKTSTAWWIAQALRGLGARCGVIGTLGVGEPPSAAQPDARITPTGLTTPDPLTLHRSLRQFADAGLRACAIEASSIGLAEHRLDALRLRAALFTNFTPDHLDYHADMAAYWAAKRVLFDWPGLQSAVVNLDDAQGAALATELRAEGRLDLWTYALSQPARLQATDLHYGSGGLSFTVHEGAESHPVRTALVGTFNASNVLGVIGVLRALGWPLAQIAPLAATFTPVPGRMQTVGEASAAAPQVVVDYAHTPDALAQTLAALRPVAAARGGQLWCVFGCGGNRDATKRPVMGEIAARLADSVVITSDNPRHEDPQAIVAQILAGCPAGAPVQAVLDRAQAIAQALTEADARDVVLLAGKGHEDYQEIAGVQRPFSDIDQATQALAARRPALESAC